MPTPIPMTPAIAGAKSGTSRVAATTPIRSTVSPRPKSATAIGRPTATTDPKAMRRMIAAAISPCGASAAIAAKSPTHARIIRHGRR